MEMVMNVAIGVDGGRVGSATLTKKSSAGELSAVVAVRWRPRTKSKRRYYELKVATPEEGLIATLSAATMGNVGVQVGRVMARELSLHGGYALLAAEDGYVPIPRGQKKNKFQDSMLSGSIKSAVKTAQLTGMVTGPLQVLTPSGEAEWVKAAEWRKRILGLSHFTKREVAKAASVKGMPDIVSGVGELLEVLAHGKAPPDDVSDSAGVSAWAHLILSK